MDFDKPKVYGDTFISDGLVIIIIVIILSPNYRQHSHSYHQPHPQLNPVGIVAIFFKSTKLVKWYSPR